MQFPTPLLRATLIRRYKRFLADIRLPDGTQVTAHCANPGAMTGLNQEGTPIWVEPNNDPKRKLNYSWKLVELPGEDWAVVDTAIPNRIVAEALGKGTITELSDYKGIRAEVPNGEGSRIDFLLTEPGLQDVYLEVKGVTLRQSDDWGSFPDSVTIRGTKHLRELTAMAMAGHRAVMLFVMHRTDCRRLKIASEIDPAYAQAFESARSAGVEMLCYGTEISPMAITLDGALPVDPRKQI